MQLANIYSTEFVVETADERAGKHYRQVFTNNMQHKVNTNAPAVTFIIICCLIYFFNKLS